MTAVGRDFMPACAHRTDAVDFHQPSDATLTDIEPRLFEFRGHPGTAIGLIAQGIMLPDMRQDLQVGCADVGKRVWKSRRDSRVWRLAKPDTVCRWTSGHDAHR
ncbi:hypothetical protein A0U89_15805 (plasmid) [Kozakia baliensis]|uniref:Uncharacterized protein n=1 Tax=Kozakia baliensis TaxID=153496 RepID=A0A1D8UYY4_9PROT|nr:hypothetical protein A0U89_15805 [Kozakia baliensis]